MLCSSGFYCSGLGSSGVLPKPYLILKCYFKLPQNIQIILNVFSDLGILY